MSRRVPKCTECGSNCYCLGYKVDIPRKTDARGWRALRKESRKRYLEFLVREAIRRVNEVHEVERRIAHLRSLGPNKDRKRLIQELKANIYS